MSKGYQGYGGVVPESVKRSGKVELGFGKSSTGKSNWKGQEGLKVKSGDNRMGQSEVKVGQTKDTKVRSFKYGPSA